MILFTKMKESQTENKHSYQRVKGVTGAGGGINWEMGIDTYTLRVC